MQSDAVCVRTRRLRVFVVPEATSCRSARLVSPAPAVVTSEVTTGAL